MEGLREGRHLAAIMFVDMVGYSAQMQANEPRAIALVRELWELLRPILKAHDGREVDLAGDGMLTEFSGALAAARCALEIHGALRRRNQERPAEPPLRVRAGLHLGDIEHRDGRVYGDGVNIAARLLPLAPPGSLVFTPHVRDQLLNVLDRAPEPLGRKALRNIREPLELWCLRGPDCSAAELAAARAAAAAEAAHRRWRFGNAVFDERTLELTVEGRAVDLERKTLDVLLVLLHHAGEVVTKDELIEGAWPGRVITDSALTTCMAKLRAALGGEAQDVIKTVHGFGYRLAAEVRVETEAAPQAPHFEFREGDRPPQRALWSLVRRLGGGGHGEVWLARHDKTREERVYKFALGPEHLASLKREITLSRVLSDGHAARDCFVRVLDWNLEQAPYFVECEYTRGGSVVDWAEAQGGLERVPLATRLEIVAQAADAVAAAHSLGVLHKDLKPANLLIEPEPLRIKLTDFGSGGVLDPERLAELGITRMGFTKTVLNTSDSGTTLYLAPEVLAGQPWTSRADVYALGLILFQLVVGDLRRTLAPGWEKDVPDELLRNDILLAAAGDAGQRLGDAAVLAQNLRSLPARRDAQRAQARAQEKAVSAQRQIERYRYRRWWTWSVTVLLTLSSFYGVFMETDYGRALFFTYDELWDSAERQEAVGNLHEAERLLRRIIVTEENRVTMKFGLFVWFAGPEYLVRARLKLAQLYWREGHLQEADEYYRGTIAVVLDLRGPDTWRYPLAQFHYAEFLAGTGRADEARRYLASAEDSAHSVLLKHDMPWSEDEGSHRKVVNELLGKITVLREQLGRTARP